VRDCNLRSLLDGVQVVFHFAGQPGVRPSWGKDFDRYLELNVATTQRLLEASLLSPSIRAFVNSSSSSIYGNQHTGPVSESDLPSPISPYGVTKLAAENLCTLYGSQFGLPVVSLRYFTVFGPRQRPDMAIERLINCAFRGTEFELNGDGSQARDFTFVRDVVEANISIAEALLESRPLRPYYNVGFGSAETMNSIIRRVEDLTGQPLRVVRKPRAYGDPTVTHSDTTLLRQDLGWRARTSLSEGLREQVEHCRTFIVEI